jgi:hypothetical protein
MLRDTEELCGFVSDPLFVNVTASILTTVVIHKPLALHACRLLDDIRRTKDTDAV